MAEELLKAINQLVKLEESKVPTGLKPLKRTVTTDIMELHLSPPWISFVLANGAGGAITVWVNNETDPLEEGTIEASEIYSCDMVYPIIHTLFLKAESTSSIVRIHGKEGRAYVKSNTGD